MYRKIIFSWFNLTTNPCPISSDSFGCPCESKDESGNCGSEDKPADSPTKVGKSWRKLFKKRVPPFGQRRDAKPKEQQGDDRSCKTPWNDFLQGFSPKVWLKKALLPLFIDRILSGMESTGNFPRVKKSARSSPKAHKKGIENRIQNPSQGFIANLQKGCSFYDWSLGGSSSGLFSRSISFRSERTTTVPAIKSCNALRFSLSNIVPTSNRNQKRRTLSTELTLLSVPTYPNIIAKGMISLKTDFFKLISLSVWQSTTLILVIILPMVAPYFQWK